MIIRKAERFIVAGLFLSMLGCVTPSEPSAPSDGPSSPPDEVDPAIYSRQHDPDDPFAYKYAEFRARRERDMASAESPRPLERYPAFHRTSEQPWGDIERILPFDWEAIRAADPDAASGLEETVRLRIAFDHPDLKITQLMIGAGGVLPAHADGAPGAYIVVGGGGEITVEGETERVSPGATVKLEPYAIRRLAASEQQALRVLWIRWAPGGDQAYIDAGYYLTGANQHLQPRQATMPDGYLFWGKAFDSERVSEPGAAVVPAEEGSFFERSAVALDAVRASLGAGRELYPAVAVFGHESRIEWLSAETMKGGGFFFSDDLGSMGPVADRMIQIARHKAIFRATRPDGRWDFNFSESAWGPRSTYVEHSHVIPEFYYVMSGPVTYGVDGDLHRSQPGDIIFNNSYSPHLAQGIVDGLVFNSFSSTFAPNGDRGVFDRPFYLVEPLMARRASARLAEDVAFH